MEIGTLNSDIERIISGLRLRSYITNIIKEITQRTKVEDVVTQLKITIA